MAVRGGLTQRQYQLLQLGVLLVPAPAQLLEAGEAFAAGLVERGEAAAVHPGVGTRGPGLQGDDLLGGAGEEFAVVGDEQHGLAGLREPLLQPALAGDVEVVVGLVEQQHLVGAAQQRLQHEPLLLAAGEGAHLPPLRLVVRARRARPWCTCPTASRPRSRGPRPSRTSACAYASWAASSSTVMMACSAASTARAASRMRGGATDTSRSRTVVSSRTDPTNCRMTPSPPPTVTVPPCGFSSPASMPQQGGLPAPLGPTRATTAPSPTRNDTSPSSALPSGR